MIDHHNEPDNSNRDLDRPAHAERSDSTDGDDASTGSYYYDDSTGYEVYDDDDDEDEREEK